MTNWTLAAAALGLLAANLLSAGFGPAAPPDQAGTLLDRMTPEERVGQLFLVTFESSSVEDDSPVAELIRDYHISGIVLQARRGNFADPPETAATARSLTEALQMIEYEGSLVETLADPDSGAPKAPEYVPLFLALGGDGSGRPLAESMPGLSALASEMAIGATWDEELASDAGTVLGRELEAIGLNLLLGPALDVVEDPRLAAGGDLGVSALGGDPFWVGVMGRAYIEGIRAGSGGRLAVVAKHFPGLGGSDRPLQDEVATVRKSLEQLRSIELAPFVAVTGANPGSEPGVVDGLLTAHIRYQGFQGNIRATTRPVSLDPQALSQILALEPLASWRQGGGITVSDSLGSRAIRRFRDPRELTFESHLVARDALLAGNDLLFLADFQASADADEMISIRNTLRFFAQKYEEDAVFAQRVDDAVLRILRLKLRLYSGRFEPEQVIPNVTKLLAIGQGSAVTFQVARAAATRLASSGDPAEGGLSDAPALGERVVFFTDVRTRAVCSACLPYMALDPRAMEDTVLRLYGPRGSDQVESWHLASFTMADLAAFLGEPTPANPALALAPREEVESAIQGADWLVFSVLDAGSQAFGSDALKVLLSRRPDLARAKQMAVFAFDVPYDLDATDISQLDEVYALYSSSAAFFDVAARLLFREVTAPGAPPVSVPGIGYDLIEAMQPDPDQVIELRAPSMQPPGGTPEAQGFNVGDSISLETGRVEDANGHSVPDGTPVDFILRYEDGSTTSVQATTLDGMAQSVVTLDRLGRLQITAESGPARASEILELNVQEGVLAFITVIAPTPVPSLTPEPTGTVGSATPTSQVASGEAGPEGEESREAGWPELGWALLGSGSSGLVVFGLSRQDRDPKDTAVRKILLTVVGGLALYNYLALGLPGSDWLLQAAGARAGLVAAVLGSLAGWGVGRAGTLAAAAPTPQ